MKSNILPGAGTRAARVAGGGPCRRGGFLTHTIRRLLPRDDCFAESGDRAPVTDAAEHDE